MKKNKSILVVIILVACLISCLIVIKSISKKEDLNNNKCDYFDEIILEVNSVTNRDFIEKTDLTSYIPVLNFNSNDYVIAEDEETNEYFIIIKNIKEEDLNKLENALPLVLVEEGNRKLKIQQMGMYTYIISSNENYSMIDGLIRSFSVCY